MERSRWFSSAPNQVGGVTALSMGEVWVPGNHHASALGINDSPESGFRYLKRLSMGYGSDAAILNLVVHARDALKYFEEPDRPENAGHPRLSGLLLPCGRG
jgi:hypothetical protein